MNENCDLLFMKVLRKIAISEFTILKVHGTLINIILGEDI